MQVAPVQKKKKRFNTNSSNNDPVLLRHKNGNEQEGAFSEYSDAQVPGVIEFSRKFKKIQGLLSNVP